MSQVSLAQTEVVVAVMLVASAVQRVFANNARVLLTVVPPNLRFSGALLVVATIQPYCLLLFMKSKK